MTIDYEKMKLAHVKKYAVGSEVWALKRRGMLGLMKGKIHDYEYKTGNYYAVFDGFGGYWLAPEEIYLSRESLIDAQIEYWHTLKNEDETILTCIECYLEAIGYAIKHNLLVDTVSKLAYTFHAAHIRNKEKS